MNALENTTSSCGSGTREVHFVMSDQLPLPVVCHVCVAGVVKVIPELPSASPRLEPVNGLAAPAPVMSMKSTFVREESVVMVTVRAVPATLDKKIMRFVAVLPLIATAPLGAKFADRVKICVFEAGPIIVSAKHAAPAAIVIAAGNPELESNVTSSAEVGAEAPLLPPVVADQCVVAETSQVPAPPTQKRAANYATLFPELLPTTFTDPQAQL